MKWNQAERVVVTSALPYVNNIPHLGNLVPILSADVFTRYLHIKQVPAIYICATDEHGTRTELEAKKAGLTPDAYCEKLHQRIKRIFDWFNVSFTYFGRTSSKENHQQTQHIFNCLHANGYVFAETRTQMYCEHDALFLPDTFIRGRCPFCNNPDASGDQCDVCGRLLNPTELLDPTCKLCGAGPVEKESRHLYLDLPKLAPEIKGWIQERTDWDGVISQLPLSWIKGGLEPRCITRDLKWGVPVPMEGFEDKVFYVWFDAPIGYISTTIRWAETTGDDWRKWWKNAGAKIVHFLGKDNVPFHTLMWPGSLLGAADGYNLPDYIGANEYLNYQGGQFSKSRGRGIFSEDVCGLGFPADYWRFYIMSRRPEKQDVDFTWTDFRNAVNTDLIQNLANYANRTLSFAGKHFGYVPAEKGCCEDILAQARALEERIDAAYAATSFRTAIKHILALSDLANRFYQQQEPWAVIKQDKEAAKPAVYTSLILLERMAHWLYPVIPNTAERLYALLGLPLLGTLSGRERLNKTKPLFALIDEGHISELERRFQGSKEKTQKQEWLTFTKHPEVAWECLILEFKDINVRRKASGLQKLKKHELNACDPREIIELPHVQAYYQAFQRRDKGQKKPSPVNLAHIVQENGSLPNINTLVDIYNLLSFKHGLVMGAYDRRAITGNLMFKEADGSEVFVIVKQEKPEPICPGEWIITDQGNMVVTRILSKQAEAVAVTRDTRDAVVCIQGNPAIPERKLQDVARELCALVKRFCGGRWQVLYPAQGADQ